MRVSLTCLAAALLLCLTPARPQAPIHNGETIILIRHGEKPSAGLGQLTCKGLNRALALPNVLIGRYGKPVAIYAPNPSDQIHDNKPGLPPSPLYSYVRPLATIEPTAIQLGLPVNTQIAFTDIQALEAAVTAPAYAGSTVYIAWEHGFAERFGRLMLQTYGLDPSVIPPWPNTDYETIYIFRIAPSAGSAPRGTLHFSIEKEGLENSLSDLCPDQQKR